ncbi:hypothetical protein ACN3XK_71785 [Actinomadura welshii]
MPPRHVPVGDGERGPGRVPLRRLASAVSAAWILLGGAISAIGLVQATAAEPVRHAPVAALAALAAPDPVDWDAKKDIRTVDGDPGGKLQWSGTGRVRVCDIEPDGHLVRGKVTQGGTEVASLRAGENGKCDEVVIPGYQAAEKKEYKFKVCLARNDRAPDGYCNTSNGRQWPEADKEEDYCDTLDGQAFRDCVGGAEEVCERLIGPVEEQCIEDNGGGRDPGKIFSTEKPNVARPPDGRAPSLDETPDATLADGPAPGYDDPRMAEPARKMLQWLTWATLGACIAGFMIVGANMAVKHKKGEAGAHAADLSWVLIATVVAGSGLAIYFVGLLLIPI